MFDKEFKFKMLFQGSRDGFNSEIFHSLCDE